MGPSNSFGNQPRQFERMASSVKCPPVHLKGRRDHRSASDGPRVVLHPRGWRDRREDHMDHQSQRSWFHGGSFRDQPTGPGVRLWGRTRSRSKGEDARRGRSSQSSQSNQAVEKEKALREGKSESYAQRQPMVMEKQRPRSEIQTAKNSVEERKKDKSSSSSTTETEKSNDSEEEDLFPEEDQIKYIHRKCPGLLTRHGIKQAKCRVLALQGEGGEGKNPEPVFVRYHRQIFAPQNPSAPLKREHLTLSTVLDCILRGEILKGSDILTQRLKSLEQIAHGAPAHLALKLEILPPESTTLASIEESRTAATQHHRELKVAEVWKGKGKQGSWGPSPPLTPGNTKGLKGNKGSGAKGIQGKGDKGDRGSKGEQSGRTAIVAPT